MKAMLFAVFVERTPEVNNRIDSPRTGTGVAQNVKVHAAGCLAPSSECVEAFGARNIAESGSTSEGTAGSGLGTASAIRCCVGLSFWSYAAIVGWMTS